MALASKLIVVLIDGLRKDTADCCCGYLAGLVETGAARYYTVCSELPCLSRPLYETLFTGCIPVIDGSVTNASSQKAHLPSVFDVVHQAGGITAIAGYGWMCELFAHTPYDPTRHKHLMPGNGSNVDAGWFYTRDDLPDEELFHEADWLINTHCPDFCVIHSMGVDEAGHISPLGGEDPAYSRAARNADRLLAERIPVWLAAGYQILVTADHGMGADRDHGGNVVSERHVPLWCMGDGFRAIFGAKDVLAQRGLARLMLEAMQLEAPESMRTWQVNLRTLDEKCS